MGKHRYDSRRRPVVILDAGYVSIRTDDCYTSSRIFGLHGKKLFCVITIVFILFSISFINLTCLVWIMYRIDWSPFHKHGSSIFHFDKVNQRLQLHHQAMIDEAIYTTSIEDSLPMDVISGNQMDIYGDHNSILLDNNQISINTECFFMKNESLVDFTNLQLFKFHDKIKTRIHLDRVNARHIHSKDLNISTNNHLTVSNVNRIRISGPNLTIDANRYNRWSLLRFAGNHRTKEAATSQQKTSYGNIDFRFGSLYLDLPRLPPVENVYRSESVIYRICVCNTTFLLLQSFAHQPCPLC